VLGLKFGWVNSSVKGEGENNDEYIPDIYNINT
jgi:hypothetical protein